MIVIPMPEIGTLDKFMQQCDESMVIIALSTKACPGNMLLECDKPNHHKQIS